LVELQSNLPPNFRPGRMDTITNTREAVRHRIAFVSRLTLPDPAAHALQTVQMAAALSQEAHVRLYVHDMSRSQESICEDYGLRGSPLEIRRLHTRRWPALLSRNGKAKVASYNSLVALMLGVTPAYRPARNSHNVVFVRSRLETLYWGLMRPRLWWLRNWLFVCEIHDIWKERDRSSARLEIAKALGSYDLILAVTGGLAEDIRALRQDLKPAVVPLCSGLQTRRPSCTPFDPTRIVLGYVGKVDCAHGVKDLFRTLDLLPDNYRLRVVGRIEDDIRPWLERWKSEQAASARVEFRSPVSYSAVAEQIDSCDIVLAPAGDTVHSRKYRSPLKLFDYMARGKPIFAADVPCHREILRDGIDACLYSPGNPVQLALKLQACVHQQRFIQALAVRAWEKAQGYTYQNRARYILDLLEHVRSHRTQS